MRGRGNRGPGLFGSLIRFIFIGALLFAAYTAIERSGGIQTLPDKISSVTDRLLGGAERAVTGFDSQEYDPSELKVERQKFLDEVKIEKAQSLEGFSRSKFLPEGYSTDDPDSEGCTLRESVILAAGTGGECSNPKGPWIDAFTKEEIDTLDSVMVASVVPWDKLWAGGASESDADERRDMVIDNDNIVIASTNLDRSGKGLDEWVPVVGKCEYTDAYARIILKNDLSVTDDEYQAIGKIWGEC